MDTKKHLLVSKTEKMDRIKSACARVNLFAHPRSSPVNKTYQSRPATESAGTKEIAARYDDSQRPYTQRR